MHYKTLQNISVRFYEITCKFLGFEYDYTYPKSSQQNHELHPVPENPPPLPKKRKTARKLFIK